LRSAHQKESCSSDPSADLFRFKSEEEKFRWGDVFYHLTSMNFTHWKFHNGEILVGWGNPKVGLKESSLGRRHQAKSYPSHYFLFWNLKSLYKNFFKINRNLFWKSEFFLWEWRQEDVSITVPVPLIVPEVKGKQEKWIQNQVQNSQVNCLHREVFSKTEEVRNQWSSRFEMSQQKITVTWTVKLYEKDCENLWKRICEFRK
jgi:hypothetical protein